MTPRSKFGGSEIILLSVLALIGAVGWLAYSNQSFAEWNIRIFNAWTSWAEHFGYLGAFLTALIGNLTVVIVFPYTLLVFFLATTGLDPVILGVLTGVGALLGELSGYFIGRWGARAVQRRKPDEYDALRRIVEQRPKIVPVLLFVFSLTPMPDDVLFIPLGMLRYPFWRLAISALLGKIGAGLIIAYSGMSLQTALTPENVRSALMYQFGTLVLLVLMFYGIAKVPWTRAMNRLLRTAK